jgi:hypothetical protein
MLAAWWIVLSVVTPLYHPYARLWLPLHAAGWLLLAGLTRESCGRSASVDARAGAAATATTSWPWAGRPRRAFLLVVLAAAVAQQSVRVPRPFSLARMFQGTAALRNVVAELPTVLPAGSGQAAPLRVLARRPLAFYLVLQGRYPFQLEASYRALVENPLPGAWAIVDETLLEPGENNGRDRLRVPPSPPDRVYREQLDPVTLLDVDPDSAYRAARVRSTSIWILAPRPSGSAGALGTTSVRHGSSD